MHELTQHFGRSDAFSPGMWVVLSLLLCFSPGPGVLENSLHESVSHQYELVLGCSQAVKVGEDRANIDGGSLEQSSFSRTPKFTFPIVAGERKRLNGRGTYLLL